MLAARTSDASSRVELMAGDVQAAEACLRADYETLTALDERYFRPNIAVMLARALFELGRHDEAEETLEIADGLASPDDIEAQAMLRTVRARLLAVHGHSPEALLLAREAFDLIGQTDSPVLRADTIVELADVFAAAPDERLSLLEEARSLYEQKRHLVGVARVDEELARYRYPAQRGSPKPEPWTSRVM